MTTRQELESKEANEVCMCIALLQMLAGGLENTRRYKTVDRAVEMLERSTMHQRLDQALDALDEGFILTSSGMTKAVKIAQRIRSLEHIFEMTEIPS